MAFVDLYHATANVKNLKKAESIFNQEANLIKYMFILTTVKIVYSGFHFQRASI